MDFSWLVRAVSDHLSHHWVIQQLIKGLVPNVGDPDGIGPDFRPIRNSDTHGTTFLPGTIPALVPLLRLRQGIADVTRQATSDKVSDG